VTCIQHNPQASLRHHRAVRRRGHSGKPRCGQKRGGATPTLRADPIEAGCCLAITWPDATKLKRLASEPETLTEQACDYEDQDFEQQVNEEHQVTPSKAITKADSRLEIGRLFVQAEPGPNVDLEVVVD
jgi:hypothetical protein